MFGLRTWIERVATEAALAEFDRRALSRAAKPVNIDSRLDDGTILLVAREKRLLPTKYWLKKAKAWQEEFCADYWHPADYLPTLDPLAVTIRKYVAEAELEVAKANVALAKTRLKPFTEKK